MTILNPNILGRLIDTKESLLILTIFEFNIYKILNFIYINQYLIYIIYDHNEKVYSYRISLCEKLNLKKCTFRNILRENV